jgi:hypothetical protein
MSNVMPWDASSYYHRIKQTLRMEASPAQSLIQELNNSAAMPGEMTLNKVVAYLADYKDAQLERVLKEKFAAAPMPEAAAALANVTAFSLTSGRLKMLDVCQRIVSLDRLQGLADTPDVIRLARADALVTPAPKRSFEMIADSISNQWTQHSGIFTKITQYFISTAAWSYSIDLDTPPTNRWVAQSQWMFFRGMVEDLKWVGVAFLQLFSSTWKAGVVAGAIFASLAGLKFVYHHYHVGTPDSLDKKYFRNLNSEAKAGLIKKTVGRGIELKMVETCLSAPPGQKPKIPILVGPPGVGKTQLVEGLAINIVNGEVPKLAGMKVFVVNTASLTEWGNFSDQGAYASRLDLLFQQIAGYEGQIILFFDEAHNAAASQQSPGSKDSGMLLESLKTKLLEKSIRCILATTDEEYQRYIVTNKPFVERTHRVDFNSLSRNETQIVLQENAGFGEDNPVEVTPDAIEAVLDVADRHPLFIERSNPRKSDDILRAGINHVYAWAPTRLKNEIQQLELVAQRHENACIVARRSTPGWSLTPPGQAAITQLNQHKARLQTLRNQFAVETAQFQKVTRLKELEPIYTRREYEVIHLVANPVQQASVEAQKTYLFLQFVLLPRLRSLIESEAALLTERMPLKVTGETIRALYPIANPVPVPAPVSKISSIWNGACARASSLFSRIPFRAVRTA